MSDEYKDDLKVSNVVNRGVSEEGENTEQITKLIKSGEQVVGYELESGKHVSVQQAIDMAKNNQLRYVGVSTLKDGSESIRSLVNGDGSNNLGNLPSITADYR